MPGNATIPNSVIEHNVADFSIIAVAAARAEGVSQEDLGQVVSNPEDASGSAQRRDTEEASDLSDYEYMPGTNTPAFVRVRYG